MEDGTPTFWIEAIRDIGVPAAIALFVLWRLDQRLGQLYDAIHDLSEKLIDRINKIGVVLLLCSLIVLPGCAGTSISAKVCRFDQDGTVKCARVTADGETKHVHFGVELDDRREDE